MVSDASSGKIKSRASILINLLFLMTQESGFLFQIGTDLNTRQPYFIAINYTKDFSAIATHIILMSSSNRSL